MSIPPVPVFSGAMPGSSVGQGQDTSAGAPAPDLQEKMKQEFAQFVAQRRAAQPSPGDVSTGAQGPGQPAAAPMPSPEAVPTPNLPVAPQARPHANAFDTVAGAIAAKKTKQDQDNITKAQNSMNLFLHAQQVGDLQTANMLATDPRIVKSWEKYIKQEYPRVPGSATTTQDSPIAPGVQVQQPTPPGTLGNMNEPGGIKTVVDPQAGMARLLAMQQQLADLRTKSAQAGNLEASARKTGIEADQLPAKNTADLALITAQTVHTNAQAEASKAEANYHQVLASGAPGLNEATIAMHNATAQEALARARMYDAQAGPDMTPKEREEVFRPMLSDLVKLRAQAMGTVDNINKKIEGSKVTSAVVGEMAKLGFTTSYQKDLKDAGERLAKIDEGIKYMNSVHDQIIKGSMKPMDAYENAYQKMGMGAMVDNKPVNVRIPGTNTVKIFSNQAAADQFKKDAKIP